MHRRWYPGYSLLVGCIITYFAVRYTQVVLGPVLPLVLEDLETSRGAIGGVFTGMWLAYAFTQLPSGALADRFGSRHIVIGSLVVTFVATIGIAIAPMFAVFAVFALLLGIGAGMYYNPATTLLAGSFDQTGRAIGIHRIGGQLAAVTSPLIAAGILWYFGWRSVIAAGALIICSSIALFWSVGSADSGTRSGTPIRHLASRSVLADLVWRSHTRNTTWMMTLVEFVGLATMAFLPTLLVEHVGLSLSRANLLFAMFFAVSAVSQPVGGWVSDRLGRDLTIVIFAGFGVTGFTLLSLGSSGLLGIGGILLGGVALGTTPVIQSRMIDGLSPERRGTGFGVFRTLYLAIGASGTTVVGVLADGVGWTIAFGLLTSLLALVFLTALLLRVTKTGSGYP